MTNFRLQCVFYSQYLQLHISFSLDISEKRRNELSFFADQNVLLKFVLDTLYVFVTFFGRAQDAELKYMIYYCIV